MKGTTAKPSITAEFGFSASFFITWSRINGAASDRPSEDLAVEVDERTVSGYPQVLA